MRYQLSSFITVPNSTPNVIPAIRANRIVCVIVLWGIPIFTSMSGNEERKTVRKIKIITCQLIPKGIAIIDKISRENPQCPFACIVSLLSRNMVCWNLYFFYSIQYSGWVRFSSYYSNIFNYHSLFLRILRMMIKITIIEMIKQYAMTRIYTSGYGRGDWYPIPVYTKTE